MSIITDPSADPHSYEANAQNQLALSKADLVVENGGGYDDFVDTMLAGTGHRAGAQRRGRLREDRRGRCGTQRARLVRLPDGGQGGEGDRHRADRARPIGRGGVRRQRDDLLRPARRVDHPGQAVKAGHAGAGVAITEPVPLYLLEASGLDNITPAEFSKAIEEGTDVSPAVLQQTLALFTDKKVAALFYNEQTTGPQTEAVLDAANNNSIPVVPVTETLPTGQDYLTWMQANITAMAQAVGG